MRGAVSVLVSSALLIGAALAVPGSDGAATPSRGNEIFVRGVALGLFASDPNWDYGPLVGEIRSRGASDVLLVVNAFQSDRFASDIALRPGRSPSEETVARTLRQVRASGMRAALMPVVRLQRRAPHEWRGLITPADGLDAWFDAYRRFVVPLARIAQHEGAARFVAGSELSSLEPYEQHWRSLIAALRKEFSGTLTYSANWDHADTVTYWDVLDEVGLTAYFPLGTDGEPPSDDTLARAWQLPRAEIDALGRRIGKPVLITEVGYASQRGAANEPWDDTSATDVDLRLQQRLYRGFCDAFSQTPSVSGFYVWNWFGSGGPRDAGFTPRGKPAASELAACFARPWPVQATVGNRS